MGCRRPGARADTRVRSLRSQAPSRITDSHAPPDRPFVPLGADRPDNRARDCRRCRRRQPGSRASDLRARARSHLPRGHRRGQPDQRRDRRDRGPAPSARHRDPGRASGDPGVRSCRRSRHSLARPDPLSARLVAAQIAQRALVRRLVAGGRLATAAACGPRRGRCGGAPASPAEARSRAAADAPRSRRRAWTHRRRLVALARWPWWLCAGAMRRWTSSLPPPGAGRGR